MLKLATLIENPGEPQAETRYRDPGELRKLGYNGIVLYSTTALSGLDSPDVVTDGEMRRWVRNTMDHVSRAVDESRQAGMDSYLFYDTLVLPEALLDRHGAAVSCKGKLGTLCPASEQAVELSLKGCEAMLSRWRDVEGVVLRFGDTDAARLPYLVGNDVYTPHCPRCSQFGRADRIVMIIQRFHELVAKRFGKRLIVRAWNVRPNGLHDSAELARRVLERLPDDDRLVMSFKFTQTDFWRYQKWNESSLVCGDRPVIYELQCQREFEGKGGIPDWQPPLWRDGCPETAGQTDVAGLAAASKQVNFAGLWAWVRGGGWGGPFVKNETWIDANVFAVPRMVDDPAASLDELAKAWVGERLDVRDGKLASRIEKLLKDSAEAVCKALYIGPFAASKSDPWHPNADWIQDDLVDAQAAWRMIQRLSDSQLDQVVAEKQEAVASISHHRAELQHYISDRRHKSLEPLLDTLQYSESLFEALRDLLEGLVAYRRYIKRRDESQADLATQKLFRAQSSWNHHTQRFGSLPGAATSFREAHFWDLTQRILDELATRK